VRVVGDHVMKKSYDVDINKVVAKTGCGTEKLA